MIIIKTKKITREELIGSLGQLPPKMPTRTYMFMFQSTRIAITVLLLGIAACVMIMVLQFIPSFMIVASLAIGYCGFVLAKVLWEMMKYFRCDECLVEIGFLYGIINWIYFVFLEYFYPIGAAILFIRSKFVHVEYELEC